MKFFGAWNFRDLQVADSQLKAFLTDSGLLTEIQLKKAEKEAEDILAKAKIQIEEEKLKLDRDMKSRLVTVSTMLIEKGLQSFLTDDQKRQITQNILKNLPKNEDELTEKLSHLAGVIGVKRERIGLGARIVQCI